MYITLYLKYKKIIPINLMFKLRCHMTYIKNIVITKKKLLALCLDTIFRATLFYIDAFTYVKLKNQ